MSAAVEPVLKIFFTCTGKNPTGTDLNVTVCPAIVTTFKSPVDPTYNTQPLLASSAPLAGLATYII